MSLTPAERLIVQALIINDLTPFAGADIATILADTATIAWGDITAIIADIGVFPTANYATLAAYVEDIRTRLITILADVTGLAGAAMRGTDNAMLAANGALEATLTSVKARTDNLPSLPDTEDTGNFNWDTSAYTTVETDISALFATSLVSATRRKYSIMLDLTNPAADGAAWTACTIKVKVKIDTTNYRTVDKKVFAKTDMAAGEEPGVNIDIPATCQHVQITMQFDVALASDRTIYYSCIKEAIE